MPFDAPVLAQLAQEINALLPMKLTRIDQPYPDEFIFSGYGKGRDLRLLIALNPQYGRIHLLNDAPLEPTRPSAFGALLAKYFVGSKLAALETVAFERIVKLSFETYDRYQGPGHKELWAELTGKSSNLILTTDQGLILDAWRCSQKLKPGEREITAGIKYQFPGTGGRWPPLTIDRKAFATLMQQLPATVTLEKFILKQWYGVSGLAINEIVRAAGYQPTTVCCQVPTAGINTLFDSFSAWMAQVTRQEFAPVGLYDTTGKALDYSAFPVNYPLPEITVRPLTELNQIVASVAHQCHLESRFNEVRLNLGRRIKQQLAKNQTKLAKQQVEAAAADQGEQWRIYGELLTAYGSGIPKGAVVARLTNFYDPQGQELEIPLDPARSALDNARQYFKKYHKAKKGRLAIATQLAKTQRDLDYLESLVTLLQNSFTLDDLELVAQELVLAAPTKKITAASRQRATQTKPNTTPRRFSTPAGHQLLVGRNNLQNDHLTFKIAGPTDWWFHTQKIPGSHVILKPQPGMTVDDATLNLACQLAVYFSQARDSTKVPVDYTQRKYVKKPPASRPGYVTYDKFQTAIITPDQQLLKGVGVITE